MKLTIKKLCDICHGEIINLDDDTLKCSSFSKDTRTINPGDVYIGIKGENFDGNLLYNDAFNKGAICSIIEKASYDNKCTNKFNTNINESFSNIANSNNFNI